MGRRSRKNRGKKPPVVAVEMEPEASSSTSTLKRQSKNSASGSKRETRSSTATNETDKVKTTAQCKDNNKTGQEMLEPPTKKSRNSRALGSPSASASRSGGRKSPKASTSKTSSLSKWSKSRDKKTEISNETSQLHQDLFPFPSEIYEKIFKELKGPHLKDLHNVWNAIPEWRKLLEKDRVLFLFPKVFEILLQKGFTDLLPVPDNARGPNGFLMYNLRLVCKSWNESIQNYIQLQPNNLHVQPFEARGCITIPNLCEVGLRFVKQAYMLEGAEWITHFMGKHRSTHSREDNPFFSRQLHIYSPEAENEADQTEFWNLVVDLLLTYGKHVYYFGVTFEDPMTPPNCIRLLHRMLSLLPNIKALNLDYNQSNYRRTTKGERRQIVREMESGEAQLPKLANLQVLEARNLPEIILRNILKRNYHLKQLKVQISRRLPISYSRIFREVAMSREFETLYLNLQTREDIEDLQTTLGATPAWPVKSLCIPFSFRDDVDDEDPFFPVNRWPQWTNIFRLIGDKFGETLVNLKIYLPKCDWDEDRKLLRDASTLRLNLPHLKQLYVEIPNLTSVDFLLGAKDTLEEVQIKATYTDQSSAAEGKREKIKFNGHFDQMETSNIWKLLPKLNKLGIEGFGNNCRGGPPRYFFKIHTYVRTKSKGITRVNRVTWKNFV